MKFRKYTHKLHRIDSLNLFKWRKEGIILTYGVGFNKRIINISDNISKDKDGTLDFLHNLLDQVEFEQQRLDIKEVINYYIQE